MSELIKNKLSDYDFVNRFINAKKNHQIIRAYYNLETGKSIIPIMYIKISNYMKKKLIYKNYKFNGQIINGMIDDKFIKINTEVHIEIRNILHNEKDIESIIEIYTLVNNFDINKFYKKLV